MASVPAKTSGVNHDDDLKDLLKGGEDGSPANTASQMAPLNLEKLSDGKLDVPVRKTRSSSSLQSVVSLICFYCSYACEYAPKLCCLMACLGIVVPLYFIILALINPTVEIGLITDEFSDFAMSSKYDQALAKVNHWCILGDDSSCRCEDPLQPVSRPDFRPWMVAQKANKLRVKQSIENHLSMDVALVGESVIEEMGGTWMGKKFNDADGESGPNMFSKTFQKTFDKANGGEVQGIPLGVAGDTNPSVLWRLQNGLLTQFFNPKVWWLQLGLNDLGRMQCSEEVVVLGILRIVEEIMNKKPDAKIVINSLLPMAEFRRGPRPTEMDYKQSLKVPQKGGKNKERLGALGSGRRNMRSIGLSLRTHQSEQATDGNDAPLIGYDEYDHEYEYEYDEYMHEMQDGIVSLHSAAMHRQMKVFGWGKKEDRGIRTDKKGNAVVKDDKHEFRKYKNGALRHERQIPLWTSITAINEELKKFCDLTTNVEFFDATDIFAAKDDEKGTWTLRRNLITFRGRPTHAGYIEWEKQIAAKVKSMI